MELMGVSLAPFVLALAGFIPVSTGPAGGVVWQGRIPNSIVAWDTRPSAVYLPPGFTVNQRYPVVYLLHGMSGSPSSFWDGLQLANVADTLITAGARPFIAVMPVAGPVVHRGQGEWAGVWESYVVKDVVPWVDAHLPTLPRASDRALEGLSAGGFGAMDIGLRHPGLFGTLGSWGGYFAPVFRDGPFVHMAKRQLKAHDPTVLVHREAVALRRAGVRFYISSDGGHGVVLGRWSTAFSAELSKLGLPYKLWLTNDSHGFWRSTLPSALAYAAAGFKTRAPIG
ncbi:MAG TPA: alpha/beta hydrolase-fold protein [Gaiellaceae bacterium]|nr:alpha/beta hydrolase-fold protein [Gaiellaceae bacterium]